MRYTWRLPIRQSVSPDRYLSCTPAPSGLSNSIASSRRSAASRRRRLGGAGWRGCSRSSSRARSSAALDATTETVRFLADSPHRAPRTGGPRRDPRRADGRRPRARAAPAARRSPTSSPRSKRLPRPSAARRGTFPILRAIADRRGSFEREIADIRRKIDPAGEVVDDASPELQEHPRAPAQAAARLRGHARVVPARQGHREVPAAAGRHRSQRPLRARRARRAPRRRFPASSTAARPAARACSSSRSAPSRSTTTSSRSSSRKRRRSVASCSR